LNSTLIDYYLKQYKQEGGKAVAQIKTIDVKNFPFIYSKKLESSMIEKIDEILSSKAANPEADTKILESEIDQLVYQLYDLTEEEIKIIKETTRYVTP
jgi:ABC-type phosphate/phosphonate transport system substrate-binding protein